MKCDNCGLNKSSDDGTGSGSGTSGVIPDIRNSIMCFYSGGKKYEFHEGYCKFAGRYVTYCKECVNAMCVTCSNCKQYLRDKNIGKVLNNGRNSKV